MRRMYLLFVFPILSLLCAEGLEYKYLEVSNSAVHVVEVDPDLYEIRPAKALDDGLGRESVTSLSARYGAVAAVNGGFFSIGGTFDGKACGALKIQDWYALPVKPRGCLGWSSSEQMPIMDRLWVKLVAHYKLGRFSIDGLNRPR